MWLVVYQRIRLQTLEVLDRLILSPVLVVLRRVRKGFAESMSSEAIQRVIVWHEGVLGPDTHKDTGMPQFLEDQARVNPSLDTLSPSLSGGSVDRKLSKDFAKHKQTQEDNQERNASSLSQRRSKYGLVHQMTRGFRQNSSIG